MTDALPMPRVLGHRGSTETAAEHTLAAYRAALDAGADGLECDVRLTRDGVPVCIHDRRVDRTSDGVGRVSTLELADLAALDFAAMTSDAGLPGGEELDRDGSGVLTLERLLDVVLDHGGPVELAIETKHPNRYGGSLEHRVVALLRQRGLDRGMEGGPRVRVMSFSALALARVKRLAPALPTVFLATRATARLGAGRLPLAADDVGPSIAVLRRDPGYVRRMHRRGRQVLVWTVNSAADVDLCCRAGVDAIITDRPRAVRQLLDARRDQAG
ncbi:MAG: glycerophosphodiester phosphodiesterase [Actinomycetota bacterium]